MSDRRSVFVLVAGAWAGGWAWRRVVPLLRAAGHEVYTPTLTGLAERAHLAGAQVDLDTHIQDVASLLEVEELEHVILVGWSYSGMVITGVLEKVPERIAYAVYLDAEVPRDGESLFDVAGSEFEQAMEESAKVSENGWSASLGTADDFASLFRPMLSDDDMLRWYAAKVAASGQPIETFRQAIRIQNPASTVVPRAFIRCPIGGEAWASIYDPIVQRIRDDDRWQVREIESSHLAPLRDPQLVADALLDISRMSTSGTGRS